MPTFSSCRGSRTCDGAATRWCWNRRAPGRCSGFAIRRLRPPWRALATPQQVGQLRRQDGFPGIELLALLADCRILFKVDAADDGNLRRAEGDHDLVLWDFHDLLFHARSTAGPARQPARRDFSACRCQPSATGGAAPLARKEDRSAQALARACRRSFRRPQGCCANVIRFAASMTSDRSRSLSLRGFSTAPRVSRSSWKSRIDLGDARPVVAYAARPYPAAGAGYELELYLAVDNCEGLARGFYHYDAGGHALVPIDVAHAGPRRAVDGSPFAMDAPAAPQIVITIAARFGRVSWKYSSLAYALILKDVGVLTANALPDGDRHGTWRMRDRQHQYRSVREDDRDRIPRRGSGRSICAWPRHADRGLPADPTGICYAQDHFAPGAALEASPAPAPRRTRNIRRGCFSASPPARIRHPEGPRIGRSSCRPALQADRPGSRRRRP